MSITIYDYIILWQGQMKWATGLCLLCFFSNNTPFINLIFSMISKMVPTKGTKNQQYLFGWIASKWGRVKFRHRRVQKSKQDLNITPNMWNKIIHLTHRYSKPGLQHKLQLHTHPCHPPIPPAQPWGCAPGFTNGHKAWSTCTYKRILVIHTWVDLRPFSLFSPQNYRHLKLCYTNSIYRPKTISTPRML